jgi:lipoprotein-anchoring transpeptidase ErfK/SrfK
MSRLIKQFAIASLLLTMAASNANAGFLDNFFNGLFSPMRGGRGGSSLEHIKIRADAYTPGEIIVSFGDRRLYYIESKATAISYAIAIPKAEAKWSGVSYVSQKQVNPTWTPTADMRRENPTLPAYVAGGDRRNPLGTRALYLGESMYRIHGTDAEWLIGQQVSHGCIRMYNRDVADLYQRAKVGSKVTITWDHFNAQAL